MSESNDNKQRKPNSWLEHVKTVRDAHPELIYRDALRLAKQSYTPVEKPKKEKVRKRKSKSKKSYDEELQSESIED